MNRRSGLGKGLSSLIPANVVTDGAIYSEIDVNAITPNQYQPRGHFDEEMLASLAGSIAAVGVIQPIVVRESDDGSYEIIAGERRWRAAKRAGLTSIPALVRISDDLSSLETAVVENLHRQDLNPLEEAAAYQQLTEDFGLTQAQVATRVGRSRSAVANTLRLLQLPASVQRLLVEQQLSVGHARTLLSTPDRGVQEHLARRIVAEGLTVREVEDLLKSDDPDDEPAPTPATAALPSETVPAPGVLELEELLTARLETRVKVQLGKGRGKLLVEFADLDDLERIYRIITPSGTIV